MPATPHPRRTRFTGRSWPSALVLLFALGGFGTSAGADDHQADAKAAELAKQSLEAMGGQEAWDGTRFIRFSFAGFRTHHWDKHGDRHRLEGQTREGDSYVVLLNLATKEGRAWLNGEELTGEALEERLEGAYGAWINDTYWLVMPYKLFDPGVTLAYEGTEEVDGQKLEKVRLTFDGVGLTPGDTYWVYFDPETHLVTRWSYVLESFEEGQEPTAWTWGDWKEYGSILLASERKMVGGDRELPMGEIAVFESLPDSVFDSPEPVTTP